jgi:prepilin-type processing-associated H-X9-DG protein
MSDQFESDPEFKDFLSKSRPTPGFRFIKILVFLGVFLPLFALSGTAMHSARKAARRAQCVNNLKQIALALDNYEQEYNALPPSYTADADGRPLHSWRTLILPYLEHDALYKSIDLAKPWNDPVNAEALATSLSVYRCSQLHRPASGGPPWNTTTYRAIVAPDGGFDPTLPRRLADVADGAKSTVMVIEVDEEDAVPWMAPVDANEGLVMSLEASANQPHPGGRNACFLDGGVRFLKTTTPDTMLHTLRLIIEGMTPPEDW